MGNIKYNLVFKGEIVEGFEVEKVKHNFTRIFKKDISSISKMFDGKKKILKRNIDHNMYLKLEESLKKAGAKCTAEKIESVVNPMGDTQKQPLILSHPKKQIESVKNEILEKGKEKIVQVEETAKKNIDKIKNKINEIDIGQQKERVNAAIYKATTIISNGKPNGIKALIKRPIIMFSGGLVIIGLLILMIFGGGDDKSGEIENIQKIAVDNNNSSTNRSDQTLSKTNNKQSVNLLFSQNTKPISLGPGTLLKPIAVGSASENKALRSKTVESLSCQRLKSFPLRGIAYKKYNPALKEYFGKELLFWSYNDFDIFINSFVECKEKHNDFFSNYNKKYFPNEVKREIKELKSMLKDEENLYNTKIAYNKLLSEVIPLSEQARSLRISDKGVSRLKEIQKESMDFWKEYNHIGNLLSTLSGEIESILGKYQHALLDKKNKDDWAKEHAESEAARQKDYALQAEEAEKLIKKYGNIGPRKEFLISQIRTYAGASESGDLGTVIKFYDHLNGKKKWKKQDKMWVLHQNMKDQVTGEKHKILHAFFDMRPKKTFVWLERSIVDGQDYPSGELFYFAMNVMGQ